MEISGSHFQGPKSLTRLGFGLSVAPRVMTAVLNHVLSSDPQVASGTDSYIDDIAVDEDIVSCSKVLP